MLRSGILIPRRTISNCGVSIPMQRNRFQSDPPARLAAPGESLEQSYRVRELPAIIPGGASRQAIWRWMLTGILDPNGERVRLNSTKVGGRRVVSHRDLIEFLRRLNPPTVALTNSGASTTNEADAARRAQEAGQALDAICGGARKRLNREQSDRGPPEHRLLALEDHRGQRRKTGVHPVRESLAH